ncbi:hypothetical protein PIB30_099836 [Stylosanthes scabra]|uniref:F-box associated beta-propeller type 1 domain-containing protein n=1 Tax=Stylosanthes scabra TaxID=79078 RepID=A0ABU6YVV4_9FABA|nr:hypothetical protein [Stylosanthes scabra]
MFQEMQAREIKRVLHLLDDMIMEVLRRSDYQTACKCRLLSKAWNMKLQSYDFLSEHYQRWSLPQSCVFIHLYFPQWMPDRNSFVRVSVMEGKVSTLPSVSSFCPGQVVRVHGILNGNICLTLELNRTCERLAVWNMFTGQTREILALPGFSCQTFRNQFGFTYLPRSICYCIIHTFKVASEQDVLMYNIYDSKSNKFSRTIGFENCVGNIHSDYISSEGVVYWLNFQPQQSHIPNSIVACSALTKGIDLYTIPDKCKSGKHKLLILNNQVCIASYPLQEDHYTFLVWGLRIISQKKVRWELKWTLDGMRIYDNLMLFLKEDLIGLIDENQQDGEKLRELMLCTYSPDEEHHRSNLIIQDWKQRLQTNVPIALTDDGWYRVIGVENGIFCFRYCSARNKSYLLAWNPVDKSTKLIPDPPEHYCNKCSFLYSFGYFPGTVHYGIVHLFKRKPRQRYWRVTMYSSVEHD